MAKMQEVPPTLAEELVRTVRGSRSQEMLRRRLGINYNRISRWETGRQKIAWTEFALLADACKLELAQLLKDIFRYGGKLDDSGALIRQLMGDVPMPETCERLGVSRATFNRWLAGKSDPSLQEVLELIAIKRARLFAFLEGLTDPAELPSVAPEYRAIEAYKRILARFPFALAATNALNVLRDRGGSDYSPGTLAKLLGITAAEEDAMLKALYDAGLIRFEGKRPAGELPQISLLVKGKAIPEVRKYWNKRLMNFFERPVEGFSKGISTRLHLSASEEALEEILAAFSAFYHKVERIRAKDKKRAQKAAFLLNFQFIDLSEL